MNALELAMAIDADLCFDYGEVSEMLCKQDAAIKQLRAALEYHIEQTRPIERSWQALTATEEIVND